MIRWFVGAMVCWLVGLVRIAAPGGSMTELSRRSAAPSTTRPRSTSTGMGKSTVHGSSGAFVSNLIRASGSRSMGVAFIPTIALRVVEIIVTGSMVVARMRLNVEGSIDAIARISGAVDIIS